MPRSITTHTTARLLLALVVAVPLLLAVVAAADRYIAALPVLVVQRGNVLVSPAGRVVRLVSGASKVESRRGRRGWGESPALIPLRRCKSVVAEPVRIGPVAPASSLPPR